MKLLVFYSYNLTNFLDDEDIIQEDQCSVTCPDDLKSFEFKDYVTKNYYEKIFNLEKSCCGSHELLSLHIDYVKYLVEF